MKIKKGFILRTVMGQNVILAEGNNSDSYGKIIKLNTSGAMLWEKLKGKEFKAEDVAELLIETYGIERERALADATRFIDLMTSHGLITD